LRSRSPDALGPEQFTRLGLDEARRYPNSPIRKPNAAFEEMANAKRPGDLVTTQSPALESA
jgi:hypothetical protein